MTEVRTPNLPELKRLNMWVQEQDKLEPGARIWNQDNWVQLREETPMCQSAYCVAGMAITRAGHKLAEVGGKKIVPSACGCSGHPPRVIYNWIELDGEYLECDDIADRATQILGLKEWIADDLFDADNSAEKIDRVIRDIFFDAGADYDATEPAPDLEIEIKAVEVEINAAEIAQGHLKLTNKLINA